MAEAPAAAGTYIAGACNIGRSEIAHRRRLGWILFAVTVAAWAALLVLEAPRPWRLFLLFPASVAAAGFIQARFRFCAAYGMRGVFNLTHDVGTTEAVTDRAFLARDRLRALQIAGLSALAGGAVALLAFLI